VQHEKPEADSLGKPPQPGDRGISQYDLSGCMPSLQNHGRARKKIILCRTLSRIVVAGTALVVFRGAVLDKQPCPHVFFVRNAHESMPQRNSGTFHGIDETLIVIRDPYQDLFC